ncbi:MAG: O-antigen ligase family protein [Usitatibacter sp.]
MTALLRAARAQLPVIAIAALGAVFLLMVASYGGPKLLILVLGVIGFGVAAAVSGNLRLFCLWAMIIAFPFDLSYRFGPVFAKLGGEIAFRVDLPDIFCAALLAYLARDLWAGRLRGLRIPKVTFLWIAIGLMGVGAIVTGPWRMTAAHEVVRMMKITLFFIVLCNELRTPGRIMQVVLAIGVAIIIQSMAGIAQYAMGGGFGLEKLGESEVVSADNVVKRHTVMRIGAFMIHPVIFATFLATLLPIALGMVLIRCGRSLRLLFALVILLGVPALILTLSRAGWLTFAITSVVLATLVMFRTKLRTKAIIPLALAGVIVAAVGLAFVEPIMARVFQSNTESEKGRTEWAQDARRMMAVKPVFGFGMNSYAFAAPPYTRLGERGAREFYEKARFGKTRFVPVVHNAYLQWRVEIGLIGWALHLAIFVMLLFMAWRNLRVHDEQLFVVNAACFAGLIGYLVDLWFGNSLRQGSTLREFWVLAALICAIHYWRLSGERSAAAAPRTYGVTAGPAPAAA